MKINVIEALSGGHQWKLENNGSGIFTCQCGCQQAFEIHACAACGFTCVNDPDAFTRHFNNNHSFNDYPDSAHKYSILDSPFLKDGRFRHKCWKCNASLYSDEEVVEHAISMHGIVSRNPPPPLRIVPRYSVSLA
jgi:hypothetical protein